jgi:hypothetical protein
VGVTDQRARVVTFALSLIGAIVAFLTSQPESPRWKVGAYAALAVLATAVAIVVHYYWTGGPP